jgi:hypothetical protein
MRRIEAFGPRWTYLGTALVVLLSAAPARSDPALYQRALRSTGWVVVPRDGGAACGTCWVADRARRLVVTCRHVVGASREVLVYFPRDEDTRPVVEAARYLREGPAVVGRVIASDPARDLALVRLASLPAGVRQMALAERSCGPGDDVHSIGNSGVLGGLEEGTLWWYTRGSVRQVHRKARPGDARRRVWLVETQAPVNEGDSGGPVVNAEGRLVGVTDSYTGGRRLVSQNIDVREVRAFLKEKRGRIRGITPDAGEGAPLGRWKFEVSGSPTSGEGCFRRGGTFLLSRAGKPLEGRYVCANSMVWLIFKKGLAQARLAWQGKDRFSLTMGESELTFDRRVLRPAGRTRPSAVAIAVRSACSPACSTGPARRSNPVPGRCRCRPAGSAQEE